MKKLHIDHISSDKIVGEYIGSPWPGRAKDPLTAEQDQAADKIYEWLDDNQIGMNCPDDRDRDVSEGLITTAWEQAQQGVDHLTIVDMGYGNYIFSGSSEKLLRDLSTHMKGAK